MGLFILPPASAQVVNLEGRWKFRIGDQLSWAKPEYDDSAWRTIPVPANWEDEGYNGYDGYAWYRKAFQGNVLRIQERYYLKLGYIDDADEVYLNGILIGFSGSMPPNYRTAFGNERSYLIPDGVLNFSGENVVAVRVFDAQQAGGIVNGEVGIYPYRSVSPMLVDLRGIWDFTTSESGHPATASAWDHIMVPSHWEKQGYRKYNGYAWYRKNFILETDFRDDDLVLLLGRIDDFDEVYLNGRLIGSTNDGRSLGHSNSYRVVRVYSIPKGLLQRNGQNNLEVLVQDIGVDGGIYDGPIGITTREMYNEFFRE